jgi:dual specificity tyrosine-phosphorylation-regulated kinase 1
VRLVDTYLAINEASVKTMISCTLLSIQLYYAKKRRWSQQQANGLTTDIDQACANVVNSNISPSKRTKIFNYGFDDSDYNYIIRVGELWDDRYRVHRLLGKGSFGQVVEAFDCVNKESVAIKIIKNRKAFHHQALLEIRIVQHLNGKDIDDSHNIGKWNNHW